MLLPGVRDVCALGGGGQVSSQDADVMVGLLALRAGGNRGVAGMALKGQRCRRHGRSLGPKAGLRWKCRGLGRATGALLSALPMQEALPWAAAARTICPLAAR